MEFKVGDPVIQYIITTYATKSSQSFRGIITRINESIAAHSGVIIKESYLVRK
jgi:ribosomal protein L19